MSKHTPGPWTIGGLESGQAAVDGANGEDVTGFISPADAALIAAAPDMLAALEAFAHTYLVWPVRSQVVIGADGKPHNIAELIARAKGTP
jgi:hypothetical protein